MDLLTANDAPGEYPASWYAATADFLAPLPPLEGDARCDVCVIGAGYTGLSAALHLAERGYAVKVLEAQRVGWGASGRNGGQVGSGQRVDQDDIEDMLGLDAARALWGVASDARALVPALIEKHDIRCDYTRGHIHAELTERGLGHTRDYVRKLREEYGYDSIRFLDRDSLHARLGSPLYKGGALDGGAAHLHPLNYALGLARAALSAGAGVHEMSRVTRIGRRDGAHIVETEAGLVRADHVILACNGYLGGLDKRVAARAMPINNFIVATEPLGEERARALIRDNTAVSDSKFVVNYYRLTPDWRLLFGGGETYGYTFPKDIAGPARAPMLRIFPQLKDVRIDHAWGGTLAITINRLPFLRRLEDGVFTACGYSGQGVALGTLAGQIIAEAVAGAAERFDVMASIPTPRFPGGAAMRRPLLVAAMTWYALRDRLSQMA